MADRIQPDHTVELHPLIELTLNGTKFDFAPQRVRRPVRERHRRRAATFNQFQQVPQRSKLLRISSHSKCAESIGM
jgi:hypothetical protein